VLVGACAVLVLALLRGARCLCFRSRVCGFVIVSVVVLGSCLPAVVALATLVSEISVRWNPLPEYWKGFLVAWLCLACFGAPGVCVLVSVLCYPKDEQDYWIFMIFDTTKLSAVKFNWIYN